MSMKTNNCDDDRLESLWSAKGLDPNKSKKPRTTLDEQNPSREFQERVGIIVVSK